MWAGSRHCAFGTSPVISTTTLPNATVGAAYSATLTAVGGRPPYAWAALSFAPNTGAAFSLSPLGIISGTPGTAEIESIVAQVTDAAGLRSTALLALQVLTAGAPFDKFISTTGSDSNPGTLSQPWAITSLISGNAHQAAISGKRVGLIAGTYDLTGLNAGNDPTDYQSAVLNIPAGPSGTPTYVAACDASGNYSRGAATITMGNTNVSTITNSNSCIGQASGGGGNVTLDGLVITAGNWVVSGPTNASGSLIGYFPSGTALPFTLQNCELSGIAGNVPSGSNVAAFFQQGAINTLVHNCHFHDVRKPVDPGHCHCVEEYSCSGTIYEFNTFANSDGACDGKLSVHNCTFRYNYVYSCANSQGAFVGYDGGEDSTNKGTNFFHHNIFDSCGQTHAFDVGGPTPQPAQWFNNTTYDTHTGSFRIVQWTSTATAAGQMQLYNNIQVRTGSGGGDAAGATALTIGGWGIVDFNCYAYLSLNAGWGTGYPSSAVTYNSLPNWQASSGTPDLHSLASTAGASFVQFQSAIVPGAGSAQFKLAAGSPCVNAGRVGGVVGGAATNMGAWDGTATQIGCNFDGRTNS